MVAESYDARRAADVASTLGVPHVELFADVTSTMDVAHRAAEAQAAAGTVLLADRQSAGRGRGGKSWVSESGRGLWFTLLERPESPSGLDVLALRLGLAAAPVLDAFADAPLRLKWPNDLYLGDRKLAGILVETRWREARVEWVAIGMGVNVEPPTEMTTAAALRPNSKRLDILAALVPALRRAAAERGPLTPIELATFAARDYAAGRPCTAPAVGVVRGVTGDGSLAIVTDSGEQFFRAGSLVLAGDTP